MNINFKELRENKGWTQTQAAIACKVAVVTWRLWEYGGGKPSVENLETVREVFNILPFADKEK
jgi:transcriptional regulator with XRE-family HTH domain